MIARPAWLRWPSSASLATLAEVAGLVAVVVGVALIYPPAAFIVGGVLAVGYAAVQPAPAEEPDVRAARALIWAARGRDSS